MIVKTSEKTNLPARPPKDLPRRFTGEWFLVSISRAPSRVVAALLTFMARRRLDHVRSELASRGFDLFERASEHHYVHRYYGRTSGKLILPFETNAEFSELAEPTVTGKRTNHYYDRLYTLYQAVAGTASRLTDGAELGLLEVGVYRGGTADFLARTAERLAPGRTRLVAVDTFEGHSEADFGGASDEGEQMPGTFDDVDFAEVSGYLARHDFVEVVRGRIQDVAPTLSGRGFHVAHIDTDLEEPTSFALEWLSERMEKGGIVVVDDYGSRTAPGVVRAVDRVIESQPGFARVVLPTAQCCLVKL